MTSAVETGPQCRNCDGLLVEGKHGLVHASTLVFACPRPWGTSPSKPVTYAEPAEEAEPEAKPDGAPTASCLSCGRPLRSAASIARRRGRACHAKHREDALKRVAAAYTPAQVAKALELIADNGVVPLKRSGVYQAVSSDGVTVYLVHNARCGCPAGLHEKPCYHRCAVALLEAWKAAA